MSTITKDQVIDWLSSQSVLEIAGLVKELAVSSKTSKRSGALAPPLP
jgi:large subunit ribosomal protein L7/L12